MFSFANVKISREKVYRKSRARRSSASPPPTSHVRLRFFLSVVELTL